MINQLEFSIVSTNDPTTVFHSPDYLRHNARRLEHLASLRIPVAGMSVLEVGAGIGDHSHYYIDRGCSVTITEARLENLQYLRMRYPHNNVEFLDLERPSAISGAPFDIVHCYGLLYHLKQPELALEFFSQSSRKILFLETCVSFGKGDELNPIPEDQNNPSQSWSGTGCRPTRLWVFKRLQTLFEHVYFPKTQPNHEEFPIDWTAPEKHTASLQRAIFVASHQTLKNDMLTPHLLNKQSKHE